MALATEAPFPQYFDLDGSPLDGGSVYFGTVNQNPETTPQQVFWDASGTQPAAQPIKTLNGYTVRAGTPANVYAAADYSLSVRDRKGRLVYYAPSAAAASNSLGLQSQITALSTSLASRATLADGGGRIGFDPTLNYAAQTLGKTIADREWNPCDYPWLAKFDGTTDDTAALLACVTALYAAGGGTMVMPKGTTRVSSLVFNWAAARSVNIRGQGQKATYIQKLGATTTPVLDFSVDVGVLDVYSTFSDFTIIGNAKTHHGLRATRLASITTENLGIQSCDVGFESVGSLVAIHERPEWQANNIGFRSRKSVTTSTIYCNLVLFRGGSIRANTTLGVDLGDASGVSFDGTKIDLNGTAANTGTGAVMIRDTVDDEIGFAQAIFTNAYFENNLGRTFQTENATNLDLTMTSCLFLSPESSRSANIGAIHHVALINCQAPGAGDTVVIGATAGSTIIGGVINTITDSSVQQTRVNVGTGTGLTPCSIRTLAVGTGGITLDPTAVIRDSNGTFTQGNTIATFRDGALAGNTVAFFATNGGGGNVAACNIRGGTNSATGRSINVGGTVNTGGADYAEYETKREDCGPLAKGDIVGFDAAGLLTDRWEHAVSFGVKSTAPSFVGGDTWFAEDRPQDENELEAFEQRLEAARQQVDRIAYCGKVPVNVIGAAVGDYIVPEATPSGGIGGRAVSSPTPAEYFASLGRVRTILPDGRAQLVVKVQ